VTERAELYRSAMTCRPRTPRTEIVVATTALAPIILGVGDCALNRAVVFVCPSHAGGAALALLRSLMHLCLLSEFQLTAPSLRATRVCQCRRSDITACGCFGLLS
jgi:hypothetical protein